MRSTNYARYNYTHTHYCGIDINISHSGKNDVEEHVGTSGYGAGVRASKVSANRSSFFAPKSSQEDIEAETRWTLFIAKHNVAFLVSGHVSNLFICSSTRKLPRISDARGQKLYTAIVKEGLAPHYNKNLAVSLAPQPFSILMGESKLMMQQTNLASFWPEHLMKNLVILGQGSSTCL